MYKLIAPQRTDSTAPPLLSVRNLSCAYTSRAYGLFGKTEVKPVLDQVNLEMAQGEIFGLTGESGCGKSTIARCILGLIHYTGTVLIDGQDETGRRENQSQQRLRRAKLCQMIFQESGASLNPVKRIGWLMEEPLRIHRLYAKEERAAQVDEMLSAKVNEMLLRVGLDPSYRKRLPHELSGGQKQRICIGRALMLSPKLLIADEAINSLDVSTGAQILNLFRELNAREGIGILFISHNTSAVEYLCDRIAAFSK